MVLQTALNRVGTVYDRVHRAWKQVESRGRIGSVLVVTYIGALGLIEANRLGFVPAGIGEHLPASHFGAVSLTFTLLLVLEVVSLVFSLVESVANSVGKQFEILSLILLRQTFKDLGELGEPVHWEGLSESIWFMASDAVGALSIFAAVGLYYRLQRHSPITQDPDEQSTFIAMKKVIALLLLGTFAAAVARLAWLQLANGDRFDLFEAFYTILIFADILVVLISMRYSSNYAVVFRNSGFAVTTVFIRLALTAPPIFDAVMGLGAALFAVGLTVAYNHLTRTHEEASGASSR